MNRITSFALQLLVFSSNCKVVVFLMSIEFITHFALNFIFQKSELAKTSTIMKCLYLYLPPVAETLEVPPFSPTSKEVLSQAVKASFAGFSQERTKHHFPHGRTTHRPDTVKLLSLVWAVMRRSYVPRCIQIPCCGRSGRWTTGWTGARESLVSTVWAPNWKVWMVQNFLVWTERLSRA